MADKNESQQILEQIAQARHDALLWQTPTIASSQTPENLTGGIAQNATTQTGGINLAAIQQQQALEMQNAMAQQMYLRSYAMGTPGVMSPTMTMANPVAANYRLQNMYMMNPYMANFFGGGGNGANGGGGGLSIAPASMMTAPSYGVFRNNQGGGTSSAFGAGSFIRDLSTMNSTSPGLINSLIGGRSFAPYEDPIDEMIAARRRMFRRGENWGIGGLSAGAAVASFMTGGPWGLAVGLGLEPAVDTIGSAYFQRRAETEQIADISRRVATGAGATGFRSRGFSLQESSGMMRGFRKEAAASPFYNMSDFMQMMDVGSQNGLFMGAGSSSGAEKKVKDMIGMIDTFMRVAGDPDVKSAMERMGRLQTMGYTLGQMNTAVGHLRAAANLAGTSVDQIMATSGAYGAQMAVSLGGPAGFGMTAGASAQGIVESMTQRGGVNQLNLSLMGGKEGLTQRVTQAMTNELFSFTAQNLGAFVKDTGGGLAVDQAAYDKFLATGKIPGGQRSLIESATSNLALLAQAGKMPDYLQHEQRLTAQLLENQSPLQQIMNMQRNMEEFRRHLGPHVTEDQALFYKFGETADEWKDILKNAPRDLLAQERETMAMNARQAQSRFVRSNSLVSRIGVGAASFFENALESIIPFDAISSLEQRVATEAEGKVFLPGLNYGLSNNARTSTLEKLGYGASTGMPDRTTSQGELAYHEAVRNKLLSSTDFVDYMGRTNPATSTIGGEISDFVNPNSWDPRRAASEQATRLHSLERLGEIARTTPEDAAKFGLTQPELELLDQKYFSGSGNSRVFDVNKFTQEMGEQPLERQASVYHALANEDRNKNAIQQHLDFQKKFESVPAMFDADKQFKLMQELGDEGIKGPQMVELSGFADYLAKTGKFTDRGKLTTIESKILNSHMTDADLEKILGKSVPRSQYPMIREKAQQSLAEGQRGGYAGPYSPVTLDKVNQAATDGSKALRTLKEAEAVAPPSAFTPEKEFSRYTEARNTLLLHEHYQALKANGQAGSEDQYAASDEGRKYADKIKTLSDDSQSRMMADTTNQNLDLNPQLSDKQNMRRMANSLDNIEVVLGRLDRYFINKTLSS